MNIEKEQNIQKKLTLKDVSLVLETNNLRGDTPESKAVFNSLVAIMKVLNQQSTALNTLGELIITHDGIPEDSQDTLIKIAECPINFVEIAPDCGYYEAKNIGFNASKGDIVVFADTDCIPVNGWLTALITPLLEDHEHKLGAVAGRTTYHKGLLGCSASSIDFKYYKHPTFETATRNFYANNIAMRRHIFATYSYPDADNVYRGHCQMLGLRLYRNNIVVHYAFDAHTMHAFPNTFMDLVRLRILRGQDTVGLTPHLVKTYMKPKWHWLSKTGPIMPLVILQIHWLTSLGFIGKQGLKPKWYQWPFTYLLMTGILTVDMIGAFFMGIGLPLQATGKNADARALDYTAKK